MIKIIILLVVGLTIGNSYAASCRYNYHGSLEGVVGFKKKLSIVEKKLSEKGFQLTKSNQDVDFTILDLDAFCEELDSREFCRKAYGTLRIHFHHQNQTKTLVKVIEPAFFYTNSEEALSDVLEDIKKCR